MYIRLNQSEIENALKSYLLGQGLAGETTDIQFTMGRKGSGLVADIDLQHQESSPQPLSQEKAPAPALTFPEGARAAEAAPEPAEEPAPVKAAPKKTAKASPNKLFGSPEQLLEAAEVIEPEPESDEVDPPFEPDVPTPAPAPAPAPAEPAAAVVFMDDTAETPPAPAKRKAVSLFD